MYGGDFGGGIDRGKRGRVIDPRLINGKLTVKLFKREVALLKNARELGRLLVGCSQSIGQDLVEVTSEILYKFGGEEPPAETDDAG